MARLDMMPEGSSVSRISAGTVIKGEIISPNDIRIDCVFEGTLKVKGKVVVGESATIKGDIICDNADICGKLDGNVFVKDTLGLKDGCVVNGNLHIRRISVELGSTFNGNCKMINETDFDKLSGVKQPAQPVHPQPAAQQPHTAPAN
ncbi:MAG: polymer-forming cytoskeletal protein [Mogibacterium sp.]|nr:polymer-forming cytoskeletal protein [Mogibacterium sp.]